MQLKIKRLTETAILPKYAHSTDSGMDLHYDGEYTVIYPGTQQTLSVGIAIELPPDTEAQLRGRSGLASRSGIGLTNGIGTIDEGYTGEIKVVLRNYSDKPFAVTPGDRIAQLVIAPVIRPTIVEVDQLGVSDRGVNGFGSTGVQRDLDLC